MTGEGPVAPEAFRRSDFEAMLNYYKANYPREPYTEDALPAIPITAPVLVIHGLDDPGSIEAQLCGKHLSEGGYRRLDPLPAQLGVLTLERDHHTAILIGYVERLDRLVETGVGSVRQVQNRGQLPGP